MLSFRKANFKDADAIAALHALSWQQNYRGAFSDNFLDNEVQSDRLLVWKERLKNTAKNQVVYLVLAETKLVGFICAYLDDHERYGTLIDNLHVKADYAGQRIGEKLILKTIKEIVQRTNKKSMYLWVLSNNERAIKFYERIGGKALETIHDFDIGDCEITKTRFFWSDLKTFVKH